MNENIKFGLQIAATGAVGFGAGCAIGAIAGAPFLAIGTVLAVSMVANTIFEKILDTVAKNKGWNASELELSKGLQRALVLTAQTVSLYALKIFTPFGLGFGLGVMAIFLAISIYKSNELARTEQPAFS